MYAALRRGSFPIQSVTRALQIGSRSFHDDYVQVLLPIRGDNTGLVVPTNALLFRPTGSYVAVVDAGGRVRLSLVQLGTDFGSVVQVRSGLAATDQVILNPADSLADGDVVSVVAPHDVG